MTGDEHKQVELDNATVQVDLENKTVSKSAPFDPLHPGGSPPAVKKKPAVEVVSKPETVPEVVSAFSLDDDDAADWNKSFDVESDTPQEPTPPIASAKIVDIPVPDTIPTVFSQPSQKSNQRKIAARGKAVSVIREELQIRHVKLSEIESRVAALETERSQVTSEIQALEIVLSITSA